VTEPLPTPADELPAWLDADQLLVLVGLDPTTATLAARTRAQMVAAAINADIGRVLDRPNPLDDPILVAGDASIRAAAAQAGINAYGRFDTKFDSAGYADMNGQAIKVARDALAYVQPQLERWRRIAVG
jgi:hypothetical protein